MEWMILPLKRYADFTGRSRRMEYWMFALGVTLFYLVLGVIAGVIVGGAASIGSAGNGAAGGLVGMFASLGILGIVFAVIWLALLVPSIAVAVRRLHDTNRSGLWLLAYIAPYIVGMIITIAGASANSSALAGLGGLVSLLSLIGGIALLVFMCLPGTPGPNRYGPDPMEGDRAMMTAPPRY